jgi:RNA polymerase sigma factor for flagellar operon FliA
MRKPALRRSTTESIGPSRAQREPRPENSSGSTQHAAKFASRDALVLEHLSLTRTIAIQIHANLPIHVDLDDMVHAGALGLIDAAHKFDADKHVLFSSYAKHRIRGAILDSLRQLDWASRDMRRQQKKVEAATAALTAKLERAPTETELAEKMGMGIDRWRAMMLDVRNLGPVSVSAHANEDTDLPAPDFPSNPDTQPDSICVQEQLRGVLGEAVRTLSERYQQVVVLYYVKELTMKEIGRTLGINESRVSQINKSALEKMAIVLQSNGINSIRAF